MTWEELAEMLDSYSDVATIVTALIALVAVVPAFRALRKASEVSREAAAFQMQREYVKLCFDHPEYSSVAQYVRAFGIESLDGLLSEKTVEQVKYLWFLSIMLNTGEQILSYVSTKDEWRATVLDQVRYHHGAILLMWPKWGHTYDERLQAVVKDALAAGPFKAR